MSTASIDARIASLFRELAAAFDDRDALKAASTRKRRLPRERTDRAAEDAVRRVKSNLRKQGIRT